MKEIIFSKYSNERSRSFAIRTDILTLQKKMGKDGWRKNGCIRKEKNMFFA